MFVFSLSFNAFSTESANNETLEANTIEANELVTTDANIETSFVFTDAKDTERDVDLTTDDQPSTLWLFIRMILVLLFVIALIYGLVYFLKRSGKSIVNDDPYLKRTALLTIAAGKTVQVVTLGNKAYILGVSDNNVTLIAEVDDEDLVNAMNLAADAEPAGKARDFASILAKFTNTISQPASTGLKQQQERLKNLSSTEDEL